MSSMSAMMQNESEFKNIDRIILIIRYLQAIFNHKVVMLTQRMLCFHAFSPVNFGANLKSSPKSQLFPASNVGFSLIEIMIVLAVLSVGILGMGLLQGTAIKSSNGAYQRSEATWLAYEILDRMRANPNNIGAYDGYTVGYGKAPVADPGAVTSSSLRTQKDIYEWQQKLLLIGGRIGLYQAVGMITKTGINIYQVNVQWQGGSQDSGFKTRQVMLVTEF